MGYMLRLLSESFSDSKTEERPCFSNLLKGKIMQVPQGLDESGAWQSEWHMAAGRLGYA